MLIALDLDMKHQRAPIQVLHWYDFICPFCYLAQNRNAVLTAHGFNIVELPFQPHPEIPIEGIPAGPRDGTMYTFLEREAKAAGLELRWPPRLPNSRRALAAAEWVRREQPKKFHKFQSALFAAHFVRGEDLGDTAVIHFHAIESGVDIQRLDAALADGRAYRFVDEAEALGRQHGVRGTPAWFIDQQLISGLLPLEEFERLAEHASR